MSKMLHEYFFDMQLFKNSEFGWVENQYLQLSMGAVAVFERKTTHFIGEMSNFSLSENLNKISKIVVFSQK